MTSILRREEIIKEDIEMTMREIIDIQIDMMKEEDKEGIIEI